MRGVDVAVAGSDGVSDNILCYICWTGSGVSIVYCLGTTSRSVLLNMRLGLHYRTPSYARLAFEIFW
jgi:hypothetical protein